MAKEFHDKYQMTCCFTEEGISFCNSLRYVFFPYGSLDSLNLSLLGIMQAVSHAQVCCFTVAKQDKAEIKALVKTAKEKMKTAPKAEAVVVDLQKLPVDLNLPKEEQLKQFKAQYVQGVLSKEQYDFMKKLLGA